MTTTSRAALKYLLLVKEQIVSLELKSGTLGTMETTQKSSFIPKHIESQVSSTKRVLTQLRLVSCQVRK